MKGLNEALAELITRWRERAELMTAHGAEQAAATYRINASELEATAAEWGAELLTLAEAAAESGYSAERLRHMVADGHLPQAGRRHSPRIRRADLPRKRGTAGTTFDAAELAHRIVQPQ